MIHCSSKPGRPIETMDAMARLQADGVQDAKYLMAYIEDLEAEIAGLIKQMGGMTDTLSPLEFVGVTG